MAKQRKASRLHPRNDLTAKFVRSILRYNKSTGRFAWIGNSHFCGKIAGARDRRGYWKIGIGQSQYTASRLAWLYVTGKWPKAEVDHKNLNRSDNRWRNLRNATIGQNGRNTRARKDSKSQLKGVHKHPVNGNWVARIRFNGGMRHIGVYDTKQKAHAAVRERARKLLGSYYRSQ